MFTLWFCHRGESKLWEGHTEKNTKMSSQKPIFLKCIFLTQAKFVKTEIKNNNPFVLCSKASLLENITDQVSNSSVFIFSAQACSKTSYEMWSYHMGMNQSIWKKFWLNLLGRWLLAKQSVLWSAEIAWCCTAVAEEC